ncbi:MAG: two-component sensor histidine kinase, partial [Acetobacteraceae bacterium]
MRLRLWPRSLAARTAFVLIAGLVVVQIAGLTIHALDRVDALRLAQTREIAVRVISIYRTVMMTAPERREAVLDELRHVPGVTAELSRDPPTSELPDEMPLGQRLLRINLNLVPLMGVPHWRGLRILADHDRHRLIIAMRIPDSDWLDLTVPVEPVRPWHSPRFLAAFLLMTVTAAGLTVWAVRRLTAPLRTLAAAAEALG